MCPTHPTVTLPYTLRRRRPCSLFHSLLPCRPPFLYPVLYPKPLPLHPLMLYCDSPFFFPENLPSRPCHRHVMLRPSGHTFCLSQVAPTGCLSIFCRCLSVSSVLCSRFSFSLFLFHKRFPLNIHICIHTHTAHLSVLTCVRLVRRLNAYAYIQI